MRYLFVVIISMFFVNAYGQEVDLKKLERSYKTQTTVGGITMIAGFGCLAGFIVKRDRHNKESEAMQLDNNHLKHARILLAFSGALTGVSAYSFVKASKNRKKYIELSGSPTSLSLCVTF